MYTGKAMRIILPKQDIIENLRDETEEFFSVNGIDIKDISNEIYLAIYCSMVIEALDYFLEWRTLPKKELEKTLWWVAECKRKEKQQSVFYTYQETEVNTTQALARLRVQAENKHSQSEDYFNRLMKSYEFNVIDTLDITLKKLLENFIEKDTWDVFEVVHHHRSIELINYGDFRILTWEMNRSKRG